MSLRFTGYRNGQEKTGKLYFCQWCSVVVAISDERIDEMRADEDGFHWECPNPNCRTDNYPPVLVAFP